MDLGSTTASTTRQATSLAAVRSTLVTNAGSATPTTTHTRPPVVVPTLIRLNGPTQPATAEPATVEGETDTVRRTRPDSVRHTPPKLLLRRRITLWFERTPQAIQTTPPIP